MSLRAGVENARSGALQGIYIMVHSKHVVLVRKRMIACKQHLPPQSRKLKTKHGKTQIQDGLYTLVIPFFMSNKIGIVHESRSKEFSRGRLG